MLSIARGLRPHLGPRLRPSARRAGFSLIEALVAITVVLILAVILVPNFLGVLVRIRLESTAKDIANLMNQTRIRAIRENAQFTVEIDGSEIRGESAYSFELNNVSIRVVPPEPITIYNPGDGAADCLDKYDGSGEFYAGDSVTYLGTGVASDTGAICIHDGEGNILQVVVRYTTTQPMIRKYLLAADSPNGNPGFFEKTGFNVATQEGNIWTWY